MREYIRGFLAKCAEAAVPPYQSGVMLKAALLDQGFDRLPGTYEGGVRTFDENGNPIEISPEDQKMVDAARSVKRMTSGGVAAGRPVQSQAPAETPEPYYRYTPKKPEQPAAPAETAAPYFRYTPKKPEQPTAAPANSTMAQPPQNPPAGAQANSPMREAQYNIARRKQVNSLLGGDENRSRRVAFSNFLKQDGMGDVFHEMFRGQDGGIDYSAASQFLQDNPEFITGSDSDRMALMNNHFKGLTSEQKEAFKNSDAVRNFRSSMNARQAQDFERKSAIQNRVADQAEARGDISGIQAVGNMTWRDPSTGEVYSAPRNVVQASGGINAYMRSRGQRRVAGAPASQPVRRTYPRNPVAAAPRSSRPSVNTAASRGAPAGMYSLKGYNGNIRTFQGPRKM